MMLAAQLYSRNSISITQKEIPQISEEEILVKVSYSAICGTDLRMIANGYKNITPSNPLVLGHEFSGIIVEVGRNAPLYHPGMHVAIAPNMGCGICNQCISGNTHLCENYKAFGINIDGGFAEYVRIPAKAIQQGNILILDSNFPLDIATLLEPLSCVYNGQEQATIKLNDSVMIFGAGPIGIMHALLAKSLGASQIMIYDLSKERMDICKKIMPDIILLPGVNLKEEILHLTCQAGVDVCITACPSPTAQAQSLEFMSMGGRVLFFGGLPAGKDLVQIPTNLIHYRQLKICGSTRASIGHYRKIADLIFSGHLDVSGIITGRYAIQDFAAACEHAKSGTGLKTIIDFTKNNLS